VRGKGKGRDDVHGRHGLLLSSHFFAIMGTDLLCVIKARLGQYNDDLMVTCLENFQIWSCEKGWKKLEDGNFERDMIYGDHDHMH
jgi:hypothetical protein